METMVIIYIVVDGSYFASYHLQGDGKKFTSTGTVLAQLGPGTHTINIKIIKLRPSGDVTVLGYNDHNVLGNNPNDKGNMTHMSLLFFEQ
jgi:hypothetical protein